MEIVPCRDRFEELIRFVARLNPDGAHHIGFFGETEADIRASLAESRLPTTRKVRLSVNANNVAAQSLYERFRFVIERVMRGYRKQVI